MIDLQNFAAIRPHRHPPTHPLCYETYDVVTASAFIGSITLHILCFTSVSHLRSLNIPLVSLHHFSISIVSQTYCIFNINAFIGNLDISSVITQISTYRMHERKTRVRD